MRVAAFGLWLMVWSPAVIAQTPPGNPIDTGLRDRLIALAGLSGDVADLTAKFTQEKHTPLLKKPLKSEGRVFIKGQLTRWENEKPYDSVTVTDGQSLRVYFPRHNTVEVYPLHKRLGDLAASPLPRLDVLLKHFQISLLDERDGRLTLNLSPLDKSLAEYIDRIVVDIDPSSGLARQVQLTDPDGERTVLVFHDIRVNTGLNDDRLKLQIPKGTRIDYPLGGGEESEEPEASGEPER